MRRFPAPPSAAGPSTPAQTRSAEAPMQYEWEKPRQFPASPFAAVASGSGSTLDAEPPKKRTHYEAMDVDTPPRPGASFPPSATATSDPFRFSDLGNIPAQSGGDLHPPAFNAGDFHPKEAFGLADEPAIQEISMTTDDPSDILGPTQEDKENLALMLREDAGPQTRRSSAGGEARKRTSRRRKVATDDEDTDASDAEAAARDTGFLDVLKSKTGRRSGDSQFSFQVHHHHAPGGGLQPSGPGSLASGQPQEPPEKWMRRSTPYVLLGYVQFGSLALLALLVISLLLLFLSTLYYDIQARLAELTVEMRGEVIQCAKAYVDNFCQERRIPALEGKCNEWEECMNREVVVVGKTRVVAETLADVVNGFVDVISFKTMLFVILTLGLTIYGSSVALANLPARTPAAPPASPAGAPPPHFAHLSPYGAPMYPYGLPYNAGATPWVVDDGSKAVEKGDEGSGPARIAT